MINEQNIAKRGVFISIHMGGFEGRKKLSKEQLKSFPSEIVRGVHDMFDNDFKKLLKAIWNLDSSIRETIKSKTTPFLTIEGLYFLKTEKIEETIDYLKEQEANREILIQTAVEAYEDAIVKFSEKYPEYYKVCKDHYISKERFKARFYFKYQFLKIAPPDKEGILSPEIYKKELAKFREGVNEMKNEVLSIVAQTLLDSTKKLSEQCEKGKPNQRTFNNLNKFLQQIDNIYGDFIDRDDMKSVIQAVKNSILGVDAKGLREETSFQEEFKKAITTASEMIKTLPDISFKRALEF